MAKKATKQVVKKNSKLGGFSLKLLLAVVLLLLSVLVFDMVENFLGGRRVPKTDWSKTTVQDQIDMEIKNAQEAIKLDIKDFDDATLGK